jgi:hypothetical protein
MPYGVEDRLDAVLGLVTLSFHREEHNRRASVIADLAGVATLVRRARTLDTPRSLHRCHDVAGCALCVSGADRATALGLDQHLLGGGLLEARLV